MNAECPDSESPDSLIGILFRGEPDDQDDEEDEEEDEGDAEEDGDDDEDDDGYSE